MKLPIGVCLGIFFAAVSLAGSLDPYQPPPVNAWIPAPQQQAVPEQSVPQSLREENPVYENFRKDIQKLEKDKIQPLIDSFSKKANAATNKQKFDESLYYLNLVDILKRRQAELQQGGK